MFDRNNYKFDEYGVLHQINYEPFNYGSDYNFAYNKLGELGKRMAYLRLGFIAGSIGGYPTSICDVGVGNGDFISLCNEMDIRCKANDVTKIDLPPGIEWTDDPFNEMVDVLTMFDVLEHIPDLSFVRNIKASYVVISCPNCLYPDNDAWMSNFKHLKPNEHLHHFNKESLVAFMRANGWECKSINNLEDIIRKPSQGPENIITAIFYKQPALINQNNLWNKN